MPPGLPETTPDPGFAVGTGTRLGTRRHRHARSRFDETLTTARGPHERGRRPDPGAPEKRRV